MQSIKVLLSIGHPIFRVGIKKIIDDQPDMCVVGEAHTCSDVAMCLNSLKPDVLVLDLQLSCLHPKEIIDFIQKSGTETRVIVLTESKDRAFLKALFELGVRGYFQKDESVGLLLKAIRVISLDGIWYGPIFKEISSKRKSKRSRSQSSIPISSRGLQTLQLIEQGLTYREISKVMGISYHTVCYHIREALRELGVHKALDAVMIAISQGWIQSSHQVNKSTTISNSQ